ncbi:MAG: pyrimidine reductase family protein [Acidimicrobiales bacterium]
MNWLEPTRLIDDVLAPYRDVDRTPPTGRAWILANMVAGLDGSTAIGGRVGQLSSPSDAALFKLLRSVADVVLVGAETVRRERYGPVRLPDEVKAAREAAGKPPVPPVAVVTRSLDLDWSAPLFSEAHEASPTMLVTCDAAPEDRLAQARRHAPVLVAGAERVEPEAAVAALTERGASTVLCEGGPTLLGELVAAHLLDELCLTMEPLMGGDPLPVAVSAGSTDPKRYRMAHALMDGNTLFLRYLSEPAPAR